MEVRCEFCGVEDDVRSIVDFDRFEEDHKHDEMWVRNDR
jgi:hypothetical protein